MTQPYTLAELPDLIRSNGGMIRMFVDVGLDSEWAPTELADEIATLNTVIEQLGPHFERIAEICGYDFAVENRGGVESDLADLAEQVGACLPPNIAGGYGLCTCNSGEAWPCKKTHLVWLAGGVDADAEIKRVCDAAEFDIWLANGPYPEDED